MNPPIPLREHEPMHRHSSWRAGGAARYYAEATTVAAALRLAAWARAEGLPLVWLGRGTNLLVRAEGFPGLIVAYRAHGWQLVEAGDTALLRVEAGAAIAGLARRIGALGWAGLAWAEGLPGSVGGAVVGNAGCYGGEVAGLLQSAELLLGAAGATWPTERLAYGYRTSVLKSAVQSTDTPPLVLAATFRLLRGDRDELAAHMAAIAAQRKAKTPTGSSCGSVFKNPPGASAGQLIEVAGLKGRAVGAAVISPVHANYIINTGAATAADILALIDLARTEVFRQSAIELELEVRII